MADEPKTQSNEKNWTTAAEADPEMKARMEAEAAASPVPSGLSITPGLVQIENSFAPALADGSKVAHVMGPQQAPCDPIAAGLDLNARPLTRNDNRVVNQTGVIGSGNRPATYVEKGVADDQKPVSDHSLATVASDADAAKAPGPNTVAGSKPTETPKPPTPPAGPDKKAETSPPPAKPDDKPKA